MGDGKRYDLDTWTCPNCGAQNRGAKSASCGRCGKKQPGDWDKPKDTYFTPTNILGGLILTTLVVGGFMFGGPIGAAIGEAIGGAATTELAAGTAVVAVGVMAAGPASAATPATPQPTTEPEVQGQVGSGDSTVDPGDGLIGDAVIPTQEPGIVYVDPGAGSTNSGTTSSSNSGGTSNSCDHPDGCGGSSTGGGQSDPCVDHPATCDPSGGSSTGGDTGGGSGSGSGSG